MSVCSSNFFCFEPTVYLSSKLPKLSDICSTLYLEQPPSVDDADSHSYPSAALNGSRKFSFTIIAAKISKT